MKINGESVLNVPNALSAYRLLALPFLIWSLIKPDSQIFITLLSINLITDILDGLIARAFKLETEFGAKLDSMADLGTYIMAICGMFVFKMDFVREHKIYFFIFIFLFVAPQIVSLIRFRRNTSFHLYSSKVVGYLQGIFIFTFFNWGYNAAYFYFMMFCSYIAEMEGLIISLVIPKLRSNVRGIYFMWKEHKKIA
jgi:cardiolipin synthase (CMP-forming)